MDREALLQRLMVTFLGELEEHVRILNQDLLALEQVHADPADLERLESLFRTVHSIKGAARSVNQQPIEGVCHRLEGLLAAARDGTRPLDAAAMQLLFGAADALEDAGDRLRAGQALHDAPVQALLATLNAGRPASGGRPARRPPRSGHAPTPPPDSRTPALSSVEGLAPSSVEGPALSPVEGPAPSPVEGRVPRSVEGPAPPAADSMRVSVRKVDALLARSGELLLARRRVAARVADAIQLREALQRHAVQWRRVEKPVRQALTRRGASRTDTLVRTGDRAGWALATVDELARDLKRLERSADLLATGIAADTRAVEQAAAPLDEGLRAIRLLPFSELSGGLARAVRDLAHGSGKQIALVVQGADVEIGRSVLERLHDPLLHLLRNAIDHGIEGPDVRAATGKPPRATITVTATLHGSSVEIAVADDGRGLDLDAVRAQASRLQLAAPADEREAARLVFQAGFSTAATVSELSGRGVGLDIVKHRVESVHGHVELSSTPGTGTRVTITVPLTLTTIRSLLVETAGQTLALPLASVRRLMRIVPAELPMVTGQHVVMDDGTPVPVTRLADVLGFERDAPAAAGRVPLILVVVGQQRIALLVDALVAEQELIVKHLGPRLSRVRHVSGATLLPTGRVALFLNAAEVVRTALGQTPRPLAVHREPAAPTAQRHLLVADDSVTTRSLEKSILESAGYRVTTAVDGADAWRLLQHDGADLVVADVEMPRMDGFTLCESIRGSKRFRDLPVVLVTARDSDADKARGLEAGANAYLPKGTFDQRQLLETIARLL